MNDHQTSEVPVWPYVLVGVMVKALLGIAAYWFESTMGKALPINATMSTICAVGAGIVWYARKIRRPMKRREMIRFAGGTAISDLFLSSLVLILPVLLSQGSLSLRNIDLALGGDGTNLTPNAMLPITLVVLFATVMTFCTSFAFAWILTRKLPGNGDLSDKSPNGS